MTEWNVTKISIKTDGGDGRRMDGKWSEWDINSRRERMTGKKEYEGKKKKRQRGVEKEGSDRGWSARERGTMKGGRENKEREGE